jgi:hypothetical protein
MNTCAWALQDVIRARPTNERILSLDAEWEVDTSRRGKGTKQCQISLLQVSYFDDDSNIKSHLYHVRKSMKKLPASVLALLTKPSLVMSPSCDKTFLIAAETRLSIVWMLQKWLNEEV